jgi:hypothetical protein
MSTDSEQRIELYLPSEVFEDVNATSNIIQARTKLNAELDPLARFFTHAPDVKTLTIEQLPTPGEDGFPDTEVAARVLQFATDYRYLLYNVAGAYYDEHLQWMAIYKLNSQKLSAFLHLTWHTINISFAWSILQDKMSASPRTANVARYP